MSDSRVEKLAQLFEGNYAVPLFEAATMIETVEAAGLTVIDASDEATINRVVTALGASAHLSAYRDVAERILAALAASR